MYLMRQICDKSKHLNQISIYEFTENQWQLNETVSIINTNSFFDFLKTCSYKFDYAVIKLNQPYRNILYYFNPHIKIVIEKEEMIALFLKTFDEPTEAFNEAAVSVETKFYRNNLIKGTHYFIYDFYNMYSKTEAVKLYELWQSFMPLNDKKIGRFIRTMEFYFDEIINYFDLPFLQRLNF